MYKDLVYALWADEISSESEETLRLFQRFSILDIELSGACFFNCRYCDSPDREKRFLVPIAKIRELIINGGIKFIFICGLGEPTAVGENYKTLVELLKICEEANIRCSIFTNLHNLTDELMGFIQRGTLNILFKLDSFDANEIAQIYNIPKHIAEEQIKNIFKVVDLVKNDNGRTNIGASIVPTKLNYGSVVATVKKCFELGIFPLLTDLECSGSAVSEFEELCLSKEELIHIKASIRGFIGRDYEVPVCPSVISGIHISHNGKVTVDTRSGLSCGWFWMDEPMPTELGDIRTDDLQSIGRKVLAYRTKVLSDFERIAAIKSNCDDNVFGGCGGNVIKLLERYKKLNLGGG